MTTIRGTTTTTTTTPPKAIPHVVEIDSVTYVVPKTIGELVERCKYQEVDLTLITTGSKLLRISTKRIYLMRFIPSNWDVHNGYALNTSDLHWEQGKLPQYKLGNQYEEIFLVRTGTIIVNAALVREHEDCIVLATLDVTTNVGKMWQFNLQDSKLHKLHEFSVDLELPFTFTQGQSTTTTATTTKQGASGNTAAVKTCVQRVLVDGQRLRSSLLASLLVLPDDVNCIGSTASSPTAVGSSRLKHPALIPVVGSDDDISCETARLSSLVECFQ